jgi:hypothetical protein
MLGRVRFGAATRVGSARANARRALAWFLALLVSVGVLIAVPQRVFAKADPSVPPVASELAPPPAPEIPKGNFKGTPQEKQNQRRLESLGKSEPRDSFDAKTSTRVDESANRDVYQNKDGSFTIRSYAGDVHVKDANGNWQDVNLDLAQGDDGRLRPSTPIVPVSIAADDSDPNLAEVDSGAGAVVLHSDRLPHGGKAKSANEKASFKADDGSGDALDISVTRHGLETNYTVPSADSFASGIGESVDLPNGWTAAQVGGDVEFSDATGAVAGRWGGGLVTDSGSPPDYGTVRTVLDSVRGHTVHAHLEVNDVWLRDAHRVYPIHVDPNLQLKIVKDNVANTGDTWVRSGNVSQNAWSDPYLYAGHHPVSNDEWQSLLTFNPALPSNADVTDAFVQLLENNNGRCPGGQIMMERNYQAWGAGTTWSNKPAFTDVANAGYEYRNPSTACTTDTTTQFHIANFTDAWNGNAWSATTGLNQPNYGVTMLQQNENAVGNGVDTYHGYHSAESAYVPEMHITYDLVAPPLTATSTINSVITTATPTFQTNQAQADPGRRVIRRSTCSR